MCVNQYVKLLFCVLLGVGGGFVFPAFATEENALPMANQKDKLEKEELYIQKSFPQYRVDFNHKLIQEEVYKELMKELKEKEKSE